MKMYRVRAFGKVHADAHHIYKYNVRVAMRFGTHCDDEVR